MAKVFPSVMVILSVLASGVYFLSHDTKHGLYWLSSAVAITVVTF